MLHVSLLALIAFTFAIAILRRQKPVGPTIHTIAVLPFENLSNDPENEYLCFGLVDEITTGLAKNERLHVIARTSSSHFSRKDDIAAIARQLKADATLEGSASRAGNHIRISAQLINSGDSLHLWAQTYDRQAADPLQIQNEISRAVASGVATRLGVPSGKNVLTPRYSTSPIANELYWKGVYFRTQRGKEDWRQDLEKSASFLEQAIQRDQLFAPAYDVLSDVYVNLAFESNGGPITENYVTRCRNAANRAIELDSSSSEAHVSLAVVQAFYDWDWRAAEKNFVRALELNPNNAKARAWYALTLQPQRRFDEAVLQAQKAVELDPLSFEVSNVLGVSYYLAGNNEQALRCARQTLQIDPRFAVAYALSEMALEHQSKYELAIAEYQKGLQLAPGHSFLQGRLGHAYAMAGRRDDALKLLKVMLAKRDGDNLSDLHIGYTYAGLGDANALFDQLDRAYRRRDPDLPYLNADPIFDGYRAGSMPTGQCTGARSLVSDWRGDYLYQVCAGSGKIASYALQITSGLLSSTSPNSTAAYGGSSLVLSPYGAAPPHDPEWQSFGFLVSLTDKQIKQFTVGNEGELNMISVGPVGPDQGIALDPLGNFAYAANSTGNSIQGVSIDPAEGTLTEIPGSPWSTGVFPIAVAMDTTGRFPYIERIWELWRRARGAVAGR
jgi:TolB-like protein/Flp pilus assembly protein TadD